MSTLRTPNTDSKDMNPNFDSTMHVDGASTDFTMRPQDMTSDASIQYGDSTFVSRDAMSVMAEFAGDYFNLKGVRYKKKSTLSESSGEAQVYLVEKDDKEYVLKVYYPNFNVNKKLLQAIYNFKFEMIVSLYDYGKTYVDGKSRYYELMEYLQGGPMSEYKLNGDIDKFRRIALQSAAALAYVHNNNILHKDIKPSNFFFRDKEHTEVVLGDFGISSMLENDGKSHRTTQARTPIYAAPEMYSDVIDGVVEITPAADFYSLGITLMALWLGGNPLSSNERVMMRQKNEGRLPHLNELPERVRMIVQGMTVVNPANRWGYDEVEKWFEGESPKVDLSSPFLKYKSFLVDPDKNLVADNIHELVPLLLDNEKLAIGYLYNGRISSWLEQCGNEKLSTIVKDIVVNKYPVDQHAGLMAAVYTMEPTYPYKDVKGALCDDVHSVAISLLSYMNDYGLLLDNPNDSLFLWLESRTKCNVARLRSYFTKTETFDPRVAVMRLVYEIDPDIALNSRHPSSNIKEIVRMYGEEKLSEDEWRCLTDGRLLSWMYSHADKMACESLRILTKDQPYSSALAYKVLYNLDRDAAYDLMSANTPQKVGEQLRERLKAAEHLSDEEFAQEMSDFTDHNGRFFYFAQLHGWSKALSEANRCFDFNSDENKERLGAYDVKTAVYRFCRILGVTPVYLLPDGTELTNGRELDPRNNVQIRNEMRNGSFIQWLSVFYHEDPFADFSEEYAYEHTVEEWLNVLGTIDSSQTYYRRFVDAKEETSNRVKNVRDSWVKARSKENTWRTAFYVLAGLWLLLMLIIGVKDRTFLLAHSFLCIGLPLGGMSGIIVATRAYFRGYDFFFSFLWGLGGAFSAFIPIIILKYIEQSHPGLFNLTVIAISLIYILICHLTDFRGDQKADSRLISEVLDNDIKSTLLEPLYYTFKTKSYRFKGSKFGLLDDVTDQVHSLSGESVLHYVLWSVLVLIFVLDFIIYSPSLLNVSNPDIDNFHFNPTEMIHQFEKDIE